MIRINDEPVKLFNELFIILALNCVWVTLTTIVHGVESLEGILSSYRLLLSVVLAYLCHKHLTLWQIAYAIFIAAVINSVVVVFQLMDALSEREFLPIWLKYGTFYGIDDVEVWRKSGLLPSLQTSSLLAIVATLFGAWRRLFKAMVFAFPFLAVAMLVGARTFVPVSLFAVAYSFVRLPIVTCAWLGILSIYLTQVTGFWDFFELRFGGLFDVFVHFNLASDYSAKNTFDSYREFSLTEFLVGNGQPRYADGGGVDPFYTRWLYQSGFPSLLLVSAALVNICRFCGRYTTLAYWVLGVAMYHNLKGELFTSLGTFDVFALIAFVYLREQAERADAIT